MYTVRIRLNSNESYRAPPRRSLLYLLQNCFDIIVLYHFVWGSAGGRDRPGYPFFLLRSYHRYSLIIDDKPLILLIAQLPQIFINNIWQTFNSSYCAVTTDIRLTIDDTPLILLIAHLTQLDIDQKTFLFVLSFYYMFYTYIRTIFFYRSTRTMVVLVFFNMILQVW